MEVVSGIKFTTYTWEQVVQIGCLLQQFSNLWDSWQPPCRKKRKMSEEDKVGWKYSNRKHFPNINYAIRQVHRILGIKGHDGRFPIPTTRSSLVKLNTFWKAMCDELKQPFFPLTFVPQDKTNDSVQKTLFDYL